MRKKKVERFLAMFLIVVQILTVTSISAENVTKDNVDDPLIEESLSEEIKEDTREDNKDATVDKEDATIDKKDVTVDKEDATVDKEDATEDNEDLPLEEDEKVSKETLEEEIEDKKEVPLVDDKSVKEKVSEDISTYAADGVTPVNANNTHINGPFYKNNMFGIAGDFHLVGLNTVTQQSHINGNILAKTFNRNGNSGTNGVKEVNYIQNLGGQNQISLTPHGQSVVVVGRNTSIGTADNGNAWAIGGVKVDNPNKANNPNGLWQDSGADYIDFNRVKQETESLSSTLSSMPNSGVTLRNSDMNNQEIEVSGSDFYVYNMKNNDFVMNNKIMIKGFNPSKKQTLVINVDMSKMSDKTLLKIPNSVAHYTNNTSVSTGEVTAWSNANVVWNVYDSTKAGGIYTGTIENNGAVTASILSPGAKVNIRQNLNGTVIAKDIHVYAESHRDDYTGPKPQEKINVSVSKVWNGPQKPRPNVTINLLADGQPAGSVVLSTSNNWKHTFTGLNKKNSVGQNIVYTVKEVPLPDYISTITGNAATGFIVTNTEIPKTVVKVNKVWEGAEKTSAIIKLLADGIEVRTVTLGNGNNWKYTFTDLNTLNPDGTEIVYTVKESAIPGYGVLITENAKNDFTVTNVQKIPIVIKVTKVWKGEVGTSVTINLLENGVKIKSTLLTNTNNWTHTFKGLSTLNSLGEVLKYTIEEVEVDGYTTEITGNVKDGFTVTNTQEVGSLEILKVDGNKVEGETDYIIASGAEFELQDPNGEVIQTGLTSTDGKFKFENLPLGSYKLVETKAPTFIDENGEEKPYNLLTEAIDVEITEIGLVKELTVKNYKSGWTLPTTGGRGTIIFNIVGVLMMLLAISVLVFRKRESY